HAGAEQVSAFIPGPDLLILRRRRLDAAIAAPADSWALRHVAVFGVATGAPRAGAPERLLGRRWLPRLLARLRLVTAGDRAATDAQLYAPVVSLRRCQGDRPDLHVQGVTGVVRHFWWLGSSATAALLLPRRQPVHSSSQHGTDAVEKRPQPAG